MLGWPLGLSKYENLIHVGKISIKAIEPKAKERYKKYTILHSGDISRVEKGYIQALKYMKTKPLGEGDTKQTYIIAMIGGWK